MAFWAAAQLVPQRDRLAEHFLQQAGFEIYAPRLRQPGIRNGRKVVATPPLFPGYLFVFIRLQWHTARWVLGVVRLVLSGGTPAAVPIGDQHAQGARAQWPDRSARLPKLRPGDRVKVTAGPFAGHVGLYAGMRPHERVEVLLAILGASQRVTWPPMARGGAVTLRLPDADVSFFWAAMEQLEPGHRVTFAARVVGSLGCPP